MATTEHSPPGRLRAWMLEGLSDMGKGGRRRRGPPSRSPYTRDSGGGG